MQDENEKPRLGLVGIALLMLMLASMACAQDCMGLNYTIKGQVLDENRDPIANAIVHAWNYDDFEQTPFGVSGRSDSEGRFDLGSVYSFACTPFQIEAYAEGYDVRRKEVYLASEYEPELLPDITLQLKPLKHDIERTQTGGPIEPPASQH